MSDLRTLEQVFLRANERMDRPFNPESLVEWVHPDEYARRVEAEAERIRQNALRKCRGR